MIVRVMGEGQYQVDDALAGRLADLDVETESAAERGDAEGLRDTLHAIADLVRTGEKLPDDHLGSSDLIVPPLDLTLDEAHKIIHEDNLIPDLP